MKLSRTFFALASLWHSVHGQESASLRGGGVSGGADTDMDALVTEDEPAATVDVAKIIPRHEEDDVQRRLGLTDWTPCSASSQCNNGCCSGMYSGGILKCTPLTGGYRSDICVGGSGTSGGTCGGGNQGNGICPLGGECCSQYGWCGTTAAHCGSGGSSSGGTCGGGNRGNGICPLGGECCSQYGWCGTSAAHCGGGGEASVLLSGSGTGTYYYDIARSNCGGGSFAETNGYPKCTSNTSYKTLAQYGTNNIVAIDNNLLNAPGGRERYCGKQIRVYRNDAEVAGGPFVVMDGCAGCGSTTIDFSLTAADSISGGRACQDGRIGGLSWSVTTNQIIPFVP